MPSETLPLCTTPNQHARPVSISLGEGIATLHGYQEFFLTRHMIRVLDHDQNLKTKYVHLQRFFTRQYLGGRSFLDLGANAGFFCFLALQNGAQQATAIDIDQPYLDVISKTRDHLGFENLEAVNSNVNDWSQPADVVIALALVHWLYSCTALYGSLEAVIQKFATLTNYLLLVEWVDPADPAIEFFHHTDWNQANANEPYTFSLFEEALSKHFVKHELVGDISPTRKLFAAYKHANAIDLSCPLPLLYPQHTVISCRELSHDPASGIPYWSRVYKLEDKICKQATRDLAGREALFLQSLEGSEYFPRLVSSQFEAGYSTVTYELVNGQGVLEAAPELRKTPQAFYEFIVHALNCLEQLELAGIRHRDIRPENVLVQAGKPILIDFGWAISDQRPYFTPPGLDFEKTPPDGTFSNVYQMGLILKKLNNGCFPFFDYVIDRMIDPESATRTENLATLRLLFDLSFKHYSSEEA
jgi:SAM-dependent methyltransferase